MAGFGVFMTTTSGLRPALYVQPPAVTLKADLSEMLEPGNEDSLSENAPRLPPAVTALIRDSFTLKEGATTTFLEQALAEGKRYEEQVASRTSLPRLLASSSRALFPTWWKRWRRPPGKPCPRFANLRRP